MSQELWSGVAIAIAISSSSIAAAQPPDPQILRELRADATAARSVRLLEGRGSPTRESASAPWEFRRGAELMVPEPGMPGVTAVLGGHALYRSTDGRRWSFVDWFGGVDHYEGLPDPTPTEVEAMVRAAPGEFWRAGASSALGPPASIPAVVADAHYTWHTVNSVTAPMVVDVDIRTGTTTVERQRWIFEVRLYRDRPDGPWTRFIATPRPSHETLAQRTFPEEVLRRAPVLLDVVRGSAETQTVDEIAAIVEAEERVLAAREGPAADRAAFRVQASPATPVARSELNDTRGNVIGQVYSQLHRASRAELETFLRANLDDRWFVSPGVLSAEGVALVTEVLYQVFGGSGDFRSQFCASMSYIPAESSPNAMSIRGAIDGTRGMISVQPNGSGYRIAALELHARHDEEGIALTRARPRAQLCPGG